MTLTISALLLALLHFKVKNQSPWFLIFFFLFPFLSYFDIHYFKITGTAFTNGTFLGLSFISLVFGAAGAVDFFYFKVKSIKKVSSCLIFLGVSSLYLPELFFFLAASLILLYSFNIYQKRSSQVYDSVWLYLGALSLLILIQSDVNFQKSYLYDSVYGVLAICLGASFMARFNLHLALAGLAVFFNVAQFYGLSPAFVWPALCLFGIIAFFDLNIWAEKLVEPKIRRFPPLEKMRTVVLIKQSPPKAVFRLAPRKRPDPARRIQEFSDKEKNENILAQQALCFLMVAVTLFYFLIETLHD